MNENIRPILIEIMQKYVSARKEIFKGHEIGPLVRTELKKEIESLPFIDLNVYTVKGSVGQGNWAAVPWLAIMHKDITSSTQSGYYIVYLFSEDMQRLYLTLAQGITETPVEEMTAINRKVRKLVPMDGVNKDNNLYLGESDKAKEYVKSTAAYIEYSIDNIPSEEKLIADLKKMIGYYEQFIMLSNTNSGASVRRIQDNEAIDHIHTYITSKGFYYQKDDVKNLYLCLKTKPFVILSGISGTGKTKIVQWLAESLGATEENGRFTLIPVRPDWSDGSDLLGYVDIKGEFQEKPLTKVLRAAKENQDKPYFVLLDEMNLARVEYYFSDLLSVMESRKWVGDEIVTVPVLSEKEFGQTLRITSNVYFIGTVNMDETTHPFSKKVLDRANTIEFNHVQLDHFSFLDNVKEEVLPIQAPNEQLCGKFLHLKDAYNDHKDLIHRVTGELTKINGILQKSGAHVGYRVRDKICFYMIYNEQENLMPFEHALDYQILQKVLPRLSGSDERIQSILYELYGYCTGLVIDGELPTLEIDDNVVRYPKSAKKIDQMLRRLSIDGFTSFWLGS